MKVPAWWCTTTPMPSSSRSARATAFSGGHRFAPLCVRPAGAAVSGHGRRLRCGAGPRRRRRSAPSPPGLRAARRLRARAPPPRRGVAATSRDSGTNDEPRARPALRQFRAQRRGVGRQVAVGPQLGAVVARGGDLVEDASRTGGSGGRPRRPPSSRVRCRRASPRSPLPFVCDRDERLYSGAHAPARCCRPARWTALVNP